MNDVELKLYCDCGDPYEFLYFSFDKNTVWTKCGEKYVKELPELLICGEFYQGKFWRRLKYAWKYIIRGKYQVFVDCIFFGWEHIEKLSEFTEQCLEYKIKEGNRERRKRLFTKNQI